MAILPDIKKKIAPIIIEKANKIVNTENIETLLRKNIESGANLQNIDRDVEKFINNINNGRFTDMSKRKDYFYNVWINDYFYIIDLCVRACKNNLSFLSFQ